MFSNALATKKMYFAVMKEYFWGMHQKDIFCQCFRKEVFLAGSSERKLSKNRKCKPGDDVNFTTIVWSVHKSIDVFATPRLPSLAVYPVCC